MLHAGILINLATSIIFSILISPKKYMVIIHRVVLSVSTGVILQFEKFILLYKGVQSTYILWTKEDITIKVNPQVVNYIGEQAKAMSELMMLNSWQIQ